MAVSNEQIPVEELNSTDDFVEYKTKEMIEFINVTLSTNNKYEGKSISFKQNLQHELFAHINQYEKDIRRVQEEYDESSNNSKYLKDVAQLDSSVKTMIKRTIDTHFKKDYVPPSPEVIEQRQQEWLQKQSNRARAYYRTDEGRQQRADAIARKKEKSENWADPLIRKMTKGEDYAAELKGLNERIDALDPEARSIISKAERRLRENADKDIRKQSEKYDAERAEIKRLFAERNRKYPSNEEDYQKRIETKNEEEGIKIQAIRNRSEERIIFMKTDYLRSGKLPNLVEDADLEQVPSPVSALVRKPIAPEIKPDKPVKPELDYDNLYVRSILHQKISVPFVKIGNNMDYYFKKYANRFIEGKCRKEGYIRPNSITVEGYSTGLLTSDNVVYDVVYSADTCYPCEDMIIKCKIVNITKIGIRAIISELYNPIVLFISREHNANKNFDDYEEDTLINIKVIGHRFELNDEYISVIGEII